MYLCHVSQGAAEHGGNLLPWCYCSAPLISKLWFWSTNSILFFLFVLVPDRAGFFFTPHFNFRLGFNYDSDFRLDGWWISSCSRPPGRHPRGEMGKKQQKAGEMSRGTASRSGCRRPGDQSLPAEIRPARGRTIVLLFSSGLINKRMRLSKRKKGFFLSFSFLWGFLASFSNPPELQAELFREETLFSHALNFF